MSITPPTSAPGAINQGSSALHPGDIDDCAPVATIYAMHMFDPGRPLPSIPDFRKAAGVPDKPGPTGMTIAQVLRGANTLWPDIRVNGGVFADWDTFNLAMSKGLRPASAQVRCSALPAGMQYGFKGLHQVCVFKDDNDDWWISNPLQANGAAPDHIGAATLRGALYGFANDNRVRAALFPVIAPPVATTAALKAEIVTLTAELAEAEGNLRDETARLKVAQAIITDATGAANRTVAVLGGK